MAIEKAFAIEASAEEIWTALYQDLSSGEEGAYEVEEAHRPSVLSLRVALGGMPARLTYRLTPQDAFVEVAATLEPLSKRYMLYQILTFGHFRRNFEMVLVEGLANLKEAVEPMRPDEAAAPGEDGDT